MQKALMCTVELGGASTLPDVLGTMMEDMPAPAQTPLCSSHEVPERGFCAMQVPNYVVWVIDCWALQLSKLLGNSLSSPLAL